MTLPFKLAALLVVALAVAAFVVAYWVKGGGAWEVAVWSPFRAWERAWDALLVGGWLRAMVVRSGLSGILNTFLPDAAAAGPVRKR